MEITLNKLGKRFNRHWIFRNVQATFEAGKAYAITGPNGSGKSTLLQLIGGVVEKSEGEISFDHNGQAIDAEDHFKYLSICAPYQELIEELTLLEFLRFHRQFRPWLHGFDETSIVDLLQLHEARHKPINQFSSGMKQRVKLAQCMLTDVPVVLLDEPTSNFDDKGFALYRQLVAQCSAGRLLLIASNNKDETDFCAESIYIPDFKINPVVP
jgi:ABC-type multidrug transport system ATPase subunit